MWRWLVLCSYIHTKYCVMKSCKTFLPVSCLFQSCFNDSLYRQFHFRFGKKNKKLLRIVILFSNLIGEIKKIHKSDFNVVLCVYLCNVSRRIKRREIWRQPRHPRDHVWFTIGKLQTSQCSRIIRVARK